MYEDERKPLHSRRTLIGARCCIGSEVTVGSNVDRIWSVRGRVDGGPTSEYSLRSSVGTDGIQSIWLVDPSLFTYK